MAKTVLISNKTYGDLKGVGVDYCHDSGVAYTNDRYFSIVNETFDYQLKMKSRLLYWFVSFWYETKDYKKKKSLSNHKYSNAQIIGALFFVGCVIGLIITIIAGLAVPIITSTSKTILLIQGKALGPIYANGFLVGWVFSNSEAAGILSNIAADPSKYGITVGDTYQGIEITAQVITNLKGQIIHFGNTYMIVNLTPEMQVMLWVAINKILSVPGSTITAEHLSHTYVILSSDSVGQANIIPQLWDAYFRKANVIVPICFTLFFILVIAAYNYRRKKFLPRMNSMSMQDYISTKILFVKKFRFILRRRLPMVKGIKELNHRFVFNSDALGSGQLYYDIRLLNYLYSTFMDMNVIMVVNVPDDATIEQLQKIVAQDFDQNIQIIVVDSDKLAQFKSVDGFGYLFNDKYLAELNQDVVSLDLNKNQDPTFNSMIQLQSKYVVDYDHKLNKEIARLTRAIEKTIFKNGRQLSNEQQKAVLEKVVAEYQRKIDVLQTDFKAAEQSLSSDN